MSDGDSYWIGRTIYESTTDHIHNLPFKYMGDPVVMKNDERIVSSYLEEHHEFLIWEACMVLSMDPLRLARTMARLGKTLQMEVLE